MLLVGKTIKVECLKTYFIGIDLEKDEDALKQLMVTRMLGGENAELHTATTFNIDEIFSKISLSIRRQKELQVQSININD